MKLRLCLEMNVEVESLDGFTLTCSANRGRYKVAEGRWLINSEPKLSIESETRGISDASLRIREGT